MHDQSVPWASTDTLLRQRSFYRLELISTPDFLYPLLHASIQRRIADINAELAARAAAAGPYVRLPREYDADAPLEDALRPLPGPRWP